jgi:hypothetical protein
MIGNGFQPRTVDRHISATCSGFPGENPSSSERIRKTATKITDREIFVFKLAAATGALRDPVAPPE